MNNQSKEKLDQLLAKLLLLFLLVSIIALPIWLFTIFGNIVFSILVFSVEMVVSLGIVLGYNNKVLWKGLFLLHILWYNISTQNKRMET